MLNPKIILIFSYQIKFLRYKLLLESQCILFQALAVVSAKVYIPPALVAPLLLCKCLGKSTHPALHSNFHSSLKNSLSVNAESAVWLTFIPRVSRNSSVAVQFPSHILHSSLKLLTAKWTVQLCSVLHQTLGP